MSFECFLTENGLGTIGVKDKYIFYVEANTNLLIIIQIYKISPLFFLQVIGDSILGKPKELEYLFLQLLIASNINNLTLFYLTNHLTFLTFFSHPNNI